VGTIDGLGVFVAAGAPPVADATLSGFVGEALGAGDAGEGRTGVGLEQPARATLAAAMSRRRINIGWVL
jgi:hypothetical protein